MKKSNRRVSGKEKKLTKLKILGFVALALAISAAVWFFVNVL